MNIYKQPPKDWKDLQVKVAEILSVCGYHCKVEKDIQTLRETINVDVLAINSQDIPSSTLICECKYWNSKVPKTIIHSLRTTVADFGANYGIIISKKGFQSGCFEAVSNTNILLFNWTEFQTYFLTKWIGGKTLQTSILTSALYNYVSAGFLVFFKDELSNLNEQELMTFNNLNSEYFHPAFHSSNLDYKDVATHKFDLNFFNEHVTQVEKIFSQQFDSYIDYFEYLVNKCAEGTRKFDLLFKQQLRRSQ
ncbi:restriction endonuclease [Flavobacterium coralii]|uniref:restriction endonuclease n=1 Tax=Flavobacterium coralii TaxID=2838017 RepID=UPI000C46236D|nr:hypothetical protein [Flavobacterium sp.]